MANQLTEVEDSIRKKIGELKQIHSNQCIYKVPEPIRNVHKQCYEPLVISIGPFYHNKPYLEHLQDLKLRHLECLIKYGIPTITTTTTYDNDKLRDYLEFIGGKEEEIRSYYAEEINIPSNEFIEMVMIDTAFIIYLFICFYTEIVVQEKPLRYKHEMLHHIQHDIFLEENQLPYFILEELYEKSFGANYPNISFKDIALNFISASQIPGTENTHELIQKLRNESDIKHLVDFLRICCLPSNVREGLRNLEAEFPPTAKELKAAGIEFRFSNSESLLDIKYKNGVLEIPKLIIQDSTESIFRNILFYEYCHHYYDSYVLDYVVFLDELIDTSEDVEILVKSGILEHWLGNHEEVANTINRIVKNIMICNFNFYYSNISGDLKKYASKSWNKYMAILRRNYFNHPWSIVSVVYLAILLILTAMQVGIAFHEVTS